LKPKTAEEGAEATAEAGALLRVKRKQPRLKQPLLKQKNPPSNNTFYCSKILNGRSDYDNPATIENKTSARPILPSVPALFRESVLIPLN